MEQAAKSTIYMSVEEWALECVNKMHTVSCVLNASKLRRYVAYKRGTQEVVGYFNLYAENEPQIGAFKTGGEIWA